MTHTDAGNGAGERVPNDLAVALSENAQAMEAWQALSPAERQAHIHSLRSAGTALARERCLRGLVNELEVGMPQHGRS